jgi:hypothetical protein
MGNKWVLYFCFCSVLYFPSVVAALGGLYVVCCHTFEDCEDWSIVAGINQILCSGVSSPWFLIKTNLIHHTDFHINLGCKCFDNHLSKATSLMKQWKFPLLLAGVLFHCAQV